MEELKPKVWFVQCKPFAKRERDSDEVNKFQNECFRDRKFGMGWRYDIFDKYTEKYFHETAEEITAIIRANKKSTKAFITAQNQYRQIKPGDVAFTRLNDIYYWGIVSFEPRVSTDKRLSWYSKVDSWHEIGKYVDLPHHVRGKISSTKYHGTIAQIDGLAALTILDYAGIAHPKQIVNENNFYCAMGDDDLEDLMAHYMSIKNRNYLFLPCSCKKNTPGIEYVMYNPKTEESIACQTKVDRIIDVSLYLEESYRKYKTVYLFSGKGYNNELSRPDNIVIVNRNDLYSVLKENRYFLGIIKKYYDLE